MPAFARPVQLFQLKDKIFNSSLVIICIEKFSIFMQNKQQVHIITWWIVHVQGWDLRKNLHLQTQPRCYWLPANPSTAARESLLSYSEAEDIS